MRIAPHVHLVASGQMGFDLTDRFDCNVYLLAAGEEYVLFDAGAGLGVDQILAMCAEDGIDTARIRHLFLTHAHADHGGGAASLREQFPVTVYAGAATAGILRVGDEEAVSLPAARRAGIYPADYRYRPCPVDRELADGERVTIGPLTVEAIATPGHSHDHMSYWVSGLDRRYLVSGDAVFHGGKVVLQDTYDCNVYETNRSIEKLADYPFEALLPGHLTFSLQRGRRHLEAACAVIAQLGCPPALG